MSANLSALFYLVSGVLFILALRGLSSPETSRQGNFFGILGMVIAITVTFLSVGNFSVGFIYVLIFLLVGGSLGAFIAFPITILLGNDVFANNFFQGNESNAYQENLLACGCGGGGGGGGGSKPGALKAKKLTSKLNFKKRQSSKKAAAGEDTSVLQAEIMKLEASIAELD